MPPDLEPIYSAEQIRVQSELPDILKAYTKQVIRANPKGILPLLEFSANYFGALAGRAGAEIITDNLTLLRSAFTMIHEAFHHFDADGSGYVDFTELQNVWKQLGVELPANVMEDMFREADSSGTGKIAFNDFVSSISMWVTVNELAKGMDGMETVQEAFRVVKNAFDTFDLDNSGYISRDELAAMLAQLGFDDAESMSDQLMTYVDTDADNKVVFKEYLSALILLLSQSS